MRLKNNPRLCIFRRGVIESRFQIVHTADAGAGSSGVASALTGTRAAQCSKMRWTGPSPATATPSSRRSWPARSTRSPSPRIAPRLHPRQPAPSPHREDSPRPAAESQERAGRNRKAPAGMRSRAAHAQQTASMGAERPADFSCRCLYRAPMHPEPDNNHRKEPSRRHLAGGNSFPLNGGIVWHCGIIADVFPVWPRCRKMILAKHR